MIPEWPTGQLVKLRMAFYNDAVPPQLADPTAVTLVIKRPDGTTVIGTQADMTHDGTGLYTYPYTIAQVGDHLWEAKGDGAVQARLEGVFVGQP